MSHDCGSCAVHEHLAQMGVDIGEAHRVVALAGNPNTGKSTLFNALTGLRQHTGNWPGKTVRRAEGAFVYGGLRYKLVDLPGTYSLLSASQDEEVARDFLLFGRPDCTVVVVDASALERNLNLALQVTEITDRVVVAVNLMDEARRRGLDVDTRSLSRDLGVPAVPIVARTGENLSQLLSAMAAVASGEAETAPAHARHARVRAGRHGTGAAHRGCRARRAERALAGHPAARRRRARAAGPRRRHARGPRRAAGRTRRSRQPEDGTTGGAVSEATPAAAVVGPEVVLERASALRRSLGAGFREEAVKSIYAEAERIARRAVREQAGRPPDLDQRIDRLVTSPVFGLPIMLLLLAVVFWLTIAGANVPSALLADLLFWIEGHGRRALPGRRARRGG
jgi:ferrous iron transport protein B